MSVGSPERRLTAMMLLAVPVCVLIGAYGWLVVEHGRPDLWGVIVHESGRYTFGGTILYFTHFLREVPVIAAMVLFVWAAYGSARPQRAAGRIGAAGNVTRGAVLLVGASAVIIGAFTAAAAEHGVAAALSELLQFHTRDDLVDYGSHWRFHFLSTIWFGVAVSVCARVLAGVPGAPVPRARRGRVLPRTIAWLYFLIMTAVFGLSTEIFLDPRYIGHQAREILTHGMVTLPLAIGVVGACGLHAGRRIRAVGRRQRPRELAALAATLLIPAWLAVATLAGDVMSSGQTGMGWSAMIAGHFFEHSLDYVVVALGVAATVFLSTRSALKRPADAAYRVRTGGFAG